MNSGYSTAATVAEAKRTHRCADFAFGLTKCGKAPLPAGERSKPERQRRLRVRGFSTHTDLRKSPSPAAHLTMRVDLSPPGRGEKEVRKCRAPTRPNRRPIWPAPS